ncbi:MAG: uroporphyrinogen-III synthase [Xanthobacteraceae bacterium]
MRLLLTRPEPDAQRTAGTLRARGHTVIEVPLIRIEAVADVQIAAGPWAAILLTSANAARALAAHEQLRLLLDRPVFAVGAHSAQAMREAGFANVTSAEGDAEDLVRTVAERMPPGASALYLTGEDRSGDLAGDLRAHGLFVHMVVLYRAAAVQRLPQAAIEALGDGIDGILHFSPRSAEAYVHAAAAAGILPSALKPVQLCLSARAAAPLRRAGAAAIRIAPHPSEAALLALIGAGTA